MPKIKITQSTLEMTASQIVNCAYQQANVLNLVDKAVRDLNNGWEGEAQKAFVDSYNKKKSTFTKLGEEMTALVGNVRLFASNMETTEIQEKKIASALQC